MSTCVANMGPSKLAASVLLLCVRLCIIPQVARPQQALNATNVQPAMAKLFIVEFFSVANEFGGLSVRRPTLQRIYLCFYVHFLHTL